jgi:hypothetical protein
MHDSASIALPLASVKIVHGAQILLLQHFLARQQPLIVRAGMQVARIGAQPVDRICVDEQAKSVE